MTWRSSRCRSCDAPIVWTITEHGKKMPVDLEPVDRSTGHGLFVLRPRYLRQRRGDDAPKAIAVTLGFFDGHDEPAYVSHFATCPHADQHRRRG